MSRRRRSLGDTVALSLGAAATGWCATTAWRGFTEAPDRFLTPLLLLALMVAAIGIGLRQLRAPAAVVLLAQLVVGGLVSTSLVAGAFVATGNGWLQLGSEITAAVDTAQRYQAPVPSDAPGIEPLLILGGWFCLVLLDLCVGGWRRVSLAGLPLLTIYSIPVSMLGGGVPWWSFTLTAAGFLLLLFLQHREQTSRWGRGLGETGRETDRRTGPETGPSVPVTSHAIRTSAGGLGAIAVLLAVLIPQFVPTMSLSVFGFGSGTGGDGDISVDNPMVDLRRDLLRGEDRPLLRVQTQDPDPDYLRIAVLNRYSEEEWSTGDRTIPEGQRAQGRIPDDDLDPTVPRERFPAEYTALPGFDSTWLPAPYPLENISAVGDWRYDVETLDFLAADDDLDTSELTYTATEVSPEYDGRTLADAPSWAGQVSRDYIELPSDFPQFVSNLAQEVTRDVPSRYEKAVALQDWFRVGGGFEYSLETSEEGNGTDDLVAFLTEGDGGRVGYCEQFAASMAVMARSLNIPARVAVGFLQPEELGPGLFEYSSDDLHAWPELYFSGAGWVKFEPTPGDRAQDVPSYTQDRIPSDEPTDQPSQSTDAGNPDQNVGPDQQLDPGAIPESDSNAGNDGTPWTTILVSLAVLVLLALLALAPRLVRRSQARSRLTGAVEPAWAEVRATALDLGLPWPERRSPRETRRLLEPHLGAPTETDSSTRPPRGGRVAPEAVEALDRLVLTLERERYARPTDGAAASDPRTVADAETVTASLRAGVTTRTLRRATWLPASVLPWQRERRNTAVPLVAGHGGVVDHVG